MRVFLSLFFKAEQQQYYIIYLDHIVSIHSSVEGHLGCLHTPALMNNATMKIRVMSILLGKCPEAELLDPLIVLVFNFFRTLHNIIHNLPLEVCKGPSLSKYH